MFHEVAGRVFVVLFPGLNVSMLPVSGGLLLCLSHLAELGVAVFLCLPHRASLCSVKSWSHTKKKTRLLLHRARFVLIHCGFKIELEVLFYF